jgi:hypothetical protein
MSLSARLSGSEFALLSGLGAARRTPNRECRFLRAFHNYIMRFRDRHTLVNFDQCNRELILRSSFRLLHEGQIRGLDWN